MVVMLVLVLATIIIIIVDDERISCKNMTIYILQTFIGIGAIILISSIDQICETKVAGGINNEVEPTKNLYEALLTRPPTSNTGLEPDELDKPDEREPEPITPADNLIDPLKTQYDPNNPHILPADVLKKRLDIQHKAKGDDLAKRFNESPIRRLHSPGPMRANPLGIPGYNTKPSAPPIETDGYTEPPIPNEGIDLAQFTGANPNLVAVDDDEPPVYDNTIGGLYGGGINWD